MKSRPLTLWLMCSSLSVALFCALSLFSLDPEQSQLCAGVSAEPTQQGSGRARSPNTSRRARKPKTRASNLKKRPTQKRKRKRRNKRRSRKRHHLKNEPALSLSQLKKAYQRELTKTGFKDAQVGWSVRRLDNGEVLLAHNAHALMHPASNTKVVTTATAARIFDPNERFVTRWYLDAPTTTSTTSTNKSKSASRQSPPRLYWRGSGDPKIVTESFEDVAAQIKRALRRRQPRGQLRIGALVIDTQDFCEEVNAPGFNDKPDDDASYRAPNGGVGFNFNRFRVGLKPGRKVGAPPVVSVEPKIPYFKIVNRAKTTRRGREQLVVKALGEVGASHMNVIVSGSIPRRHKRVSVARRVVDPHRFAGESLLYYLKRAGVKSSGEVRQGTVPLDLEPVVEHRSPLMSSLLRDINVYSNNYMAEQILLALGLKVRSLGSWREGQLVVRSYLEGDLGLKGYRYHNGSGLFGDTAFSPHMITEILIKAHETSQGAFAKTLPKAGREGTLRKRLKSLPRDAVRAKTGTLDDVSSLCGYITTRERVPLVFCMITNEIKTPTWRIKSLEDEMVSFLWLLKLPIEVTPMASKEVKNDTPIEPSRDSAGGL